MDKKDKKKKLWEIVVAILACIVFVTALFIINNITESDNDVTANTQAKTQSTEVATKDMLDNGMSYLDEDKYKFVCEQMNYNHVMFTDEDLTDKYAKMDIMLTKRYTLSSKDMENESISKVVNAYNLQAGFFTGVVKNKNGEYGEENIYIYFSKDFDLKSGNYKAGDKITTYGLIVNCKNNGAGNYNSVSFIPRFIEQ
jgi:hypothetical protein